MCDTFGDTSCFSWLRNSEGFNGFSNGSEVICGYFVLRDIQNHPDLITFGIANT